MIKSFTGVAYIAAMHKKFPLKALRVFRGVHKPVMAVLWGFFGKNKKPMIEYMRQCADRPHMLEIYLLHRWGDTIGSTDRRLMSRLLEQGNPKLIKKIRRRIAKITKFVEKYSNENTVLVLGLDLESHMTKKAVQVVQDLVDEQWPYETCSISHKGIKGADYVEHHNDYDLEVGQIGSLDGDEIRFKHRDEGNYGYADSISEEEAHDYMERNYGIASAIMYWSKRHQGLTGNTASSKSPKQRDIEIPMPDVKWMRKSIKRIQE